MKSPPLFLIYARALNVPWPTGFPQVPFVCSAAIDKHCDVLHVWGLEVKMCGVGDQQVLKCWRVCQHLPQGVPSKKKNLRDGNHLAPFYLKFQVFLVYGFLDSIHLLGDGLKDVLFSPLAGEMIHFDNMFQLGWNYQLLQVFLFRSSDARNIINKPCFRIPNFLTCIICMIPLFWFNYRFKYLMPLDPKTMKNEGFTPPIYGL